MRRRRDAVDDNEKPWMRSHTNLYVATSSRSPLTVVAESVCGRICLWNMSAPSHPDVLLLKSLSASRRTFQFIFLSKSAPDFSHIAHQFISSCFPRLTHGNLLTPKAHLSLDWPGCFGAVNFRSQIAATVNFGNRGP